MWTTAAELSAWPPEATWTLPTYIGVLTCGVLAAVLAQRKPPRLAGAAGVLIVLANSWWHSDGHRARSVTSWVTCPRGSGSR